MSKKELTTKETNLPAAPMSAWGAENITSDDITVPVILLMQPLSQYVTDGVAKPGTMIDSLSKEKVLGDEKKAVEVIIFGSFKTWREEHDGKYKRTIPWGPDNASFPWEEELEDGTVVERDLVQNFYVLTTEDIAKGEAFPYVVKFKGMSMQAAKQLGTHLKKLQTLNKPSASKVFSLKTRKDSNDKGTFWVFEPVVLRDSTDVEMATAYTWYKTLQSASVKVHDEDEQKQETKTQASKKTRDVSGEVTV